MSAPLLSQHRCSAESGSSEITISGTKSSPHLFPEIFQLKQRDWELQKTGTEQTALHEYSHTSFDSMPDMNGKKKIYYLIQVTLKG